jgi:glycosyltransferase involved in cell wall biosynthesis
VAKKRDNIKFIIAGDVVDKERNIFFDEEGRRILFKDINAMITDVLRDESLAQRIEIIGEVTDTNRKLGLLKSADIFVLPSFSEGCPMSVLEALAVGLPVIVTPVGSLREIIKEGQNGMFIKFADPEDLCEKIIALANDHQLRKAIGEKNKALIRVRFSQDVIASRIAAVFDEL